MSATPMFTKRHYETIAAILRQVQPRTPSLRWADDPRPGVPIPPYVVGWTQLVSSFAAVFALDNPRFDRVTFVTACMRDRGSEARRDAAGKVARRTAAEGNL